MRYTDLSELWCGRLACTVQPGRPHHKNTLRRGLTLVELLVVISIIGLLGGIIGLIAPRFAERSRVAQGSSQLRSWIMIAKQRALRDKAPRGVRFLMPPTQGTLLPRQDLYNKFAYVEQPEDISGILNDPQKIPGLPDPSDNSTPRRLSPAFQPNPPRMWPLQEPGPSAAMWWYTVGDVFYVEGKNISSLLKQSRKGEPPDVIEVQGARYSIYQAFGHSYAINNRTFYGTVIVTHRKTLTSPASPPPNTPVRVDKVSFPCAFRISRSPQLIAGEPELALPKNVAVDVLYTDKYNTSSISLFQPTRSLPAPDIGDPPSSLAYDIMFSASGEVTGALTNTGRIVLWMRDTTLVDPGPSGVPDGENRLLVIHSRTGQVTAHPVCTDLIPGSNPPQMDFYRFVRDGKSSALEE